MGFFSGLKKVVKKAAPAAIGFALGGPGGAATALGSGLFGGGAAATSGPGKATAAQKALQQQQVAKGRISLREAADTERDVAGLRRLAGQTSEFERQFGRQTRGQLGIQDELREQALADIRSGGAATPEQTELIRQITEGEIAAGRSDIDASLARSLGLLREELAPSRGLRSSDSPIIDRGGVLAGESLRLQERLTSGARARQAENLLNFPLQAQALRGQQIGQQQSFGLDLSQLQDRLQLESFQKRLNVGNLSLGLAGQATSPVGFQLPTISRGAEGPGLGRQLLEGFAKGAISSLGTSLGTK